MSNQVYMPEFMSFYIVGLVLLFFVILVYVLNKYSFKLVGKLMLVLCFASLIILLCFEMGKGAKSDEVGLLYATIGVEEVYIFTHPYIFLILAVVLGGKKRRTKIMDNDFK